MPTAPRAVSCLVPRLTTSILVLLVLLLGPMVLSSQAATQKVLYAFTGGTDGREPYAGVVFDKAGNLYGTAQFGGASGHGTVFQLTRSLSRWTFHLVYTFTGGTDGSVPIGGVVIDDAGNLYGTASSGGDPSCQCGTVFELSPTQDGWTFNVLHTFTGGVSDGASPAASMVFDGQLVGTTVHGGNGSLGTVFLLTHSGGSWTKSQWDFASANKGSEPWAPVSTYGGIYSTTYAGGPARNGNVFDIFIGKVHVIHTFGANTSAGAGVHPLGGLAAYGGNFYGTTYTGSKHGRGAVFQLIPNPFKIDAWNIRLVHSFMGADGANPSTGVVFDNAGTMYGTTSFGGAASSGNVYQISFINGKWVETVLYTFTGGNDGNYPAAGVVLDRLGHLYGTTIFGGAHNGGVVYKITK